MTDELQPPEWSSLTRSFLSRALSALALVTSGAYAMVPPVDVPGRIDAAGEERQAARLAQELNELNMQISQMQASVKSLQVSMRKRSAVDGYMAAGSHVAGELPAAGGQRSGSVMLADAAAVDSVSWAALLQRDYKKISIFLLLLLAGGTISGYRKYGAAFKRSIFAQTYAEGAGSAPERLPASEIGERSLKTPAIVESEFAMGKSGKVIPLSSASAGSPLPVRQIRYIAELAKIDAMIEEAELYAMHGRWDNAIEILNNIILEFPEKIEAWLLLLSIFRNKASARQFELIARTFLRTMGSNDTWKEIQQAGRSIDPGNRLYFYPDYARTANAEHRIKPNKRRLLGHILIDMKAISSNDLDATLANFDQLRDGRLGGYLITCGLIKRIQLDNALRQQESESSFSQFSYATSFANPVKAGSISDALIQMDLVTEPELDHVLADFDSRCHGRCGNYLVTRGLITQKQLHAALLQQLSGVQAAEIVAPDEAFRRRVVMNKAGLKVLRSA